jgi:hypothetical protein
MRIQLRAPPNCWSAILSVEPVVLLALADDVIEYSFLCNALGPKVARSVISLPRGNSVAFGAKQT